MFLIDAREAVTIINSLVAAIAHAWPEVCGQAQLSAAERDIFGGRLFLNPYAFENAPQGLVARPLLG
jgi:serine/threonine-protein kinase HipA